jgi:aldehyde:ferredoxin oxidoreductase
MQGPFNGKFLHIDLTAGTTAVEEVPPLTYRMYLGGAAMLAYLLNRELKPGVDPLGPENVLVFATSVGNGSALSGSTRFSVGAKSPLSKGYGESEAGGWWGPELKLAGFDAVIVKGVSPRPVYVWIGDGQAELRDAAHLWGKISGDVQDTLKGETDRRARVLQCGIAGENGVRFANIVNELKHFNGRCGLGAVMGSKRLKAIAVRGKDKLEPKNPEAMAALLKWHRETYDRNTDMLHKLGTPRTVRGLNKDGILPTHNFQRGQFEQADEISGERMKETILADEGTCFACAVACKRDVEVPELGVTPRYGGPEYETIGSSGSGCGIGDLKIIAKFNQLCAEYVMDTISTGVSISFAMECFENGLITAQDTDGLALRFGNADALLAMTEKIARREGFGAVLADGVRRAAQQIGNGAERFAMHVKDQEIPLHEPRGKQSMSLAYTMAPGGADHCRHPHDPAYEGLHPEGAHALEPLGLCEPLKRLDLSQRKVRAYYYATNWNIMMSSTGMCQLAVSPANIINPTRVTDLVRALTGWDTSLWELMKVGERGKALARVFNCREGMSPKDEVLPARFHEAFTDGPLQGVRVDPETFAKARRLYYQMEGWDPETGWPSYARLAELGIEWAAKPGDAY